MPSTQEFSQVSGCNVQPEKKWGDVTVLPACIGGVGLAGCVRQEQCMQIRYAKSDGIVAELLTALHEFVPTEGIQNAA